MSLSDEKAEKLATSLEYLGDQLGAFLDGMPGFLRALKKHEAISKLNRDRAEQKLQIMEDVLKHEQKKKQGGNNV